MSSTKASGQAAPPPSTQASWKSACTGCKRKFDIIDDHTVELKSPQPPPAPLVLHYHGPRDDGDPAPPPKRRRLVLNTTIPAPPPPEPRQPVPRVTKPAPPPRPTAAAPSKPAATAAPKPAKPSSPPKKKKKRYPCASRPSRKGKAKKKAKKDGELERDEFGIAYYPVSRPKPGQKLQFPRRTDYVLPWRRPGVIRWADGSWDHKDSYSARMTSYWGYVMPWSKTM